MMESTNDQNERLTLESILIEEDVFVKVAVQLDSYSLKNLERTAVSFWNLVKRTKVWKKKFLREYPDFSTNPANSDIIEREKHQHHWDEHFKFKKLFLKLSTLESNWFKRNYIKRSQSLAGESEQISYFDSSYLLTSSFEQFFSTVTSLKEINRLTSLHQFPSEPRFQVRSAHVDRGLLAMFGEPQLSEVLDYDYNFKIRIFSLDTRLTLRAESEVMHENDVTLWSQVKICKDNIVLYVTDYKSIFGHQDDVRYETVHLFTLPPASGSGDESPALLIPTQRISLEQYPKFLRRSYFDDEFVVGVRKNSTMVKIWDLRSPVADADNHDRLRAPEVWSRDVSCGNLIKCTCVSLQHPLILVGKNNGWVDVWDTRCNTRVTSLVHGHSREHETHLRLEKIVLIKHLILTLSSEGKIYIWDKRKVLELEETRVVSEPEWTVKSTKKGLSISDFTADETKIVTVETEFSVNTSHIVTYDFWHLRKPNQFTSVKHTISYEGINPQKRRKK